MLTLEDKFCKKNSALASKLNMDFLWSTRVDVVGFRRETWCKVDVSNVSSSSGRADFLC